MMKALFPLKSKKVALTVLLCFTVNSVLCAQMLSPNKGVRESKGNGYAQPSTRSDLYFVRNIEELGSLLEKIQLLHPVSFHYNEESGYDSALLATRFHGFIAQELRRLFPDMVGEATLDGEAFLTVNLSDLPIYMLKAMQEQQQELERKKAKVATQEERLKALKQENENLKRKVSEIQALKAQIQAALEKRAAEKEK